MINRFKVLFEGLKWRGNIYVGLLLSLLLVMGLYSTCRIGFYLFNTAFFPDMTASRAARILWGGFRFDVAGILYLNVLFVLLLILPLRVRFHARYQKTLKYIFFITNGIGLAANVADSVYYRFSLRRTTMTLLGQFENETNLGALFFQFLLDYWYAVFFWAALMYILIRVFNLISIEGPQLNNRIAFYSFGILLMPLIIYGVVGGVRGGFASSTRPITISNAAEYATSPKDINLILNTPFAFIRTARANVIERANYFTSDDALQKEFTPVHMSTDTIPFQAQNVVVIILESFSKEFIGFYNKDLDGGTYKGYAPFIDSLLSQSRVYQYSMANGRKSIDAMPSVICSIPSIEVPYVLSHYSGNKVNSLPSLLKKKGYHTSFFHGAPNGSMGFQAFANQCGFDDYFGKDEYGNNDDYDGIWGIWDEPFLQFFANKLHSFKEPFYTTLFTVSSHHPDKVPEQYVDRFKGGPLSVHRTIQYTDYALKKFFEKVSKEPWYKNTLFVFTADHASAGIQYPDYNNAAGYFSIPVFFYKSEQGWASFSKGDIAQQIDIMPTILGYLHYDQPYVAFGRNVFDTSSESFAFNFIDNTYQLFKADYLLQFDGVKSIGLYAFQEDRQLKNNLINEMPEIVTALETRIKAFIQQYNNRMVDDNLTSESAIQSPATLH